MQLTLTDLIIQFFKLSGVIWAALFGVMALITDFRDEKSQQVTIWGRVALSGIIVSTVFAVGSQLLEYDREQRAQRTAVQQLSENVVRQNTILENLDNVLGEIDRQNHALTDVMITVALQFSENHSIIEDYFDDLSPLFNSVIQRYSDGSHWFNPKLPSVYVNGDTGADGHVESIWLPVPQDIFPKEAIGVSLSVGVYPPQASVSDIKLSRSRSDTAPSPDVSFALYSGRLEAGRLHYFPSRKSFVFEFRNTPGSLTTTRSSMSIRDLQGKLLTVGILGSSRDEASISLVGLQFKLPSGVALTVGSDVFEATSNTWPDVSFYTIVDSHEHMGQWPVEHVLP